MNGTAILERALSPAEAQLSHPETEELCFNRPGEAWWLRTGHDFERIEMPEMDYCRLHGIAVLAAAQTRQTIGRRKPLMGADLQMGSTELRVQAVLPPAVPSQTISLTFRRHGDAVFGLDELDKRYDTSRWNGWDNRKERKRATAAHLLDMFDTGDLKAFLRALVTDRRTALFSGSTGVGKSTLLKTILPLLPMNARVVVIEDAREAVVPQPNHVRLIYSEGGLSGGASIIELMQASLRMRPRYVVLQEMRNPAAAWTFVREVLSGHPGSPTTIHGGSAQQAAMQLFNMVKSSAEGATIRDETLIDMLSAAIDCIVPLGNDGKWRSVEEVWFRDHVERRGESFADLLR